MSKLSECLRAAASESGADPELVRFASKVIAALIEPAEDGAPPRVRSLIAHRFLEVIHTCQMDVADIEAARATLRNSGLYK